MSVVGIIAAWGLFHTSPALHFAFYAFGAGTSFTSPEVEVTSRVVIRTTLAHGILAFFHNTAILALVVNLLIAGAA